MPIRRGVPRCQSTIEMRSTAITRTTIPTLWSLVTTVREARLRQSIEPGRIPTVVVETLQVGALHMQAVPHPSAATRDMGGAMSLLLVAHPLHPRAP